MRQRHIYCRTITRDYHLRCHGTERCLVVTTVPLLTWPTTVDVPTLHLPHTLIVRRWAAFPHLPLTPACPFHHLPAAHATPPGRSTHATTRVCFSTHLCPLPAATLAPHHAYTFSHLRLHARTATYALLPYRTFTPLPPRCTRLYWILRWCEHVLPARRARTHTCLLAHRLRCGYIPAHAVLPRLRALRRFRWRAAARSPSPPFCADEHYHTFCALLAHHALLTPHFSRCSLPRVRSMLHFSRIWDTCY